MIMDSPMGANVLNLFQRTRDWHRLNDDECHDMCRHINVVSSFQETMAIRENDDPKIVIAGSGMLTGGRILNYLEKHAQNPLHTLLFVGYQAEGTRGRDLLEGAQGYKAFGKWVPFRMQIESLEGLSAHADQDELLDWLNKMKSKPKRMFIVHGEHEASQALKKGIKDTYGWEAEIPELYSIVTV